MLFPNGNSAGSDEGFAVALRAYPLLLDKHLALYEEIQEAKLKRTAVSSCGHIECPLDSRTGSFDKKSCKLWGKA